MVINTTQHTPQRHCIMCGGAGPAPSLFDAGMLRLFLPPKTTCDVLPARGGKTYVCITYTCLSNLYKHMIAGDMLQAFLHDFAQKQILTLLGLARRAGLLVWGVDKLAALHETGGRDGVFFCKASDLAERGQRVLSFCQTFVTSDVLSQATGLQMAFALAITSDRLAEQAVDWLRVWQTTAPQNSFQTHVEVL